MVEIYQNIFFGFDNAFGQFIIPLVGYILFLAIWISIIYAILKK
jgi:hypothetical protein